VLSARLGAAGSAVSEALEEARAAGVVSRIWDRDASLWSSDADVQTKIANRLGWLDVPGWALQRMDELRRLSADARSFSHAVLLGMGGSSLAPEVLAATFGASRLVVLDSTDPSEILAKQASIDPKRTMFFVASKSGETIETRSHAAHFLGSAGDAAHFVAVTDPGSPLETFARERGFGNIFLNPPDIGGRYSALSFFGLAPSSAAGIDPAPLLSRARSAGDSCREGRDDAGLQLGVALGELARGGRDKVTIVASPGLSSFGAWAEQLLAESTGKDGRGLIPIDGEPLGPPEAYGEDRVFVHLRLGPSRAHVDALRRLERAGHPVLTMRVAGPEDVGALFFQWEFATAIAGWRLGVNPFDEPNVSESKQNTARIISTYEQSGSLPGITPVAAARGIKVFGVPAAGSVVDALRAFLKAVRPGDYVALQAFVPRNEATAKTLRAIRTEIRDHLHVATTAGFGPRFLHSTGQLHKGGPPKGVFLQITTEHPEDVAIPGQRYSFGVLQAAQAAGDFDSLKRHGRPVARAHVTEHGLPALTRIVREALSS